MRVSVKEDDPGYCEDSHLYTVLLDGVKVDDCFTADEETCEVFCHNTVEAIRRGEPEVIRRRGVVTIVKDEVVRGEQ